MTCIVAGDSIAEGLSPYIPGAVVNAKKGLPSGDIIDCVQNADVVILSAGSNDPHNPRLADNLRAIRAKARGRVVWILPVNYAAAAAVNKIAAQNKDRTVAFVPGPDRIHPSSYSQLAKGVQHAMKAA